MANITTTTSQGIFIMDDVITMNDVITTNDVTTISDMLDNATYSNTFLNTSHSTMWMFYIPSTAHVIAIIVATIFGIIGNIFVLILTTDVKLSFLSYSVYLKFLAVSDGTVLATTCIHETLRFFHVFHEVFGNLVLCDLWRGVRFLVALLSPWLVVGLTVDRFYCVMFPLTRNRFCTRRKAMIVCSCMTFVSFVLILPLLIDVSLVDDPDTVCILNKKIATYFASIRLFLNSILPCLLILILNILIAVQIQRSASFRRRFSSARSALKENNLEKSLLPLMLISILAFLTLLPLAISESAVVILLASKIHGTVLNTLIDVWPAFNVLYLVNFGQNFYILVSTSFSYRRIMQRKLNCWKPPLQLENVAVPRFSVESLTSRTQMTDSGF